VRPEIPDGDKNDWLKKFDCNQVETRALDLNWMANLFPHVSF